MLAGHRVIFSGSHQNRVTRVLEPDEAMATGTIPVGVVTVREVIVRDALFIDLAGSTQRYGFVDAPFALSAG